MYLLIWRVQIAVQIVIEIACRLSSSKLLPPLKADKIIVLPFLVAVEADNFSEPEEDPEEYENEETDEQKLELDNPIDMIDESRKEIELVTNERASEQHKHRETSRKRRKSRWEDPQSDESCKKRQTRWDEQGPQNGLFNSLVLSVDPNTIHLRTKLMEINQKLQSCKFHDEIKKKLLDKRKSILSKLAEILTLDYDPDKKFVRKLLIPQEEYPEYNFIGLILGPKGTTLKKMESETRARIFIRGRGSGDPNSEDEKLHVLVETAEKKRLDSAVAMIEKLLIPVQDKENHHKQAQLSLLAKMRGNYKDDNNTCELCKEPGHKKYACPHQDSTFNATCCDLCGSIAHTTSNCDAHGLPQFCRDKSNKDVDPTNLYISSLPFSVCDKRLREIFLPFGSIVRARVLKHEATGLSKGFGFVRFENASDAADAVRYMNGHKMEGRILVVRVAGLRAGPQPAIQASCSYNGAVESYMLPQAPPLCAAPFTAGYSADVAKTEVLNVPPPYYFVSSSTSEHKGTGNDSSDYDFCDRIPSSVPNTVSRFPGDPDYNTGSEFGQYFFSSPVTNEAQYRKSNFWGGSDFFL
ncbi:splicing factor-related, partial [Striga asiatica]